MARAMGGRRGMGPGEAEETVRITSAEPAKRQDIAAGKCLVGQQRRTTLFINVVGNAHK